MEVAQNVDRVRKTSTDDEEDISQEKVSVAGVRTDVMQGKLPCPSLRLSTESLLECLKNVSEIQPEACNLDEYDNVRKLLYFLNVK